MHCYRNCSRPCTTFTCVHCTPAPCYLYPLQEDFYTPLHHAAKEGHTACVEHLLSTPGIDVDTAFKTIYRCFYCARFLCVSIFCNDQYITFDITNCKFMSTLSTCTSHLTTPPAQQLSSLVHCTSTLTGFTPSPHINWSNYEQ